MEPTKRQFAARQMETTEAAIHTFGASQLYVSLGDIAPDKAVVVRIYWKPLVTFIWLGALVMALGGILSLSDRRLRVGAPRPARKPVAVAGGVVAMRRLLLGAGAGIRLLSVARLRGDPRRNARRSGAGGAGTGAVGGTPLHGLPEPVDRRFGRAARP